MKTVLITGVSGGIGSAMAQVFQSAGWKVWGVDLASTEPCSCLDRFIPGDVAEEDFWQNDVVSAFDREGLGVDALINVAAIQVVKSMLETSVSEWDRVMAVNLRAPFLAMRVLAPAMGGRQAAVVNISSVHALATSPEIAAYAASKGGVSALTRAAALELACLGIRVNAILPGAVRTPMLEAGRVGRNQFDDLQVEMERLASKTPLHRIGQPHEIAQAALFLADGDKSSFMTGQSMVIDGGVLARLCTE